MAQDSIKQDLRWQHRNTGIKKKESNVLNTKLSDNLGSCATAAQEKGVSSWLTALPVAHHGFALNKGEFRDSIALLCHWPLERVPENCA